MNKSNSKVFGFVSSYGQKSAEEQAVFIDEKHNFINWCDGKLPIIGEEIRQGDTLVVSELKALCKTVKQIVEYLLLMTEEGIHFESIQEPYMNLSTKEGQQVISVLRVITEASKHALSKNSSDIEGSGAKLGSYNKDKDAAIIGMYTYTQNVSAIATALDVSRNTVYKSIDRHNLK